MFWTGLTIATGAVSSAMAYGNAKDEARRQNAVIDTQLQSLKLRREHERSLFELQTFSRYYDASTAGTLSIARQASLGAGGSTSYGQMDVFRARRDTWLGRKEQKHKEVQYGLHKKSLEAGKRDPSAEGWAAAIEGITSFIPLTYNIGKAEGLWGTTQNQGDKK